METKELKVEIPEGYEIDVEKSTFDKIVFKKKKNINTYEDICKELFTNNITWYIDRKANPVGTYLDPSCILDSNNLTSEKQAKKILALIKLMNIATYLNNGWKPDWECKQEEKYYIYKSACTNQLVVYFTRNMQETHVYFKSLSLAQQAIEILGEETIKLALSSDY